MSRVLLTGASGLVGTALLERLLQDGHDVVAADRVRPRVAHPRLRWIEVDFALDPERVARELPTDDVIVHAGGAVRLPAQADELSIYRRTNAEFSERLFRRCAEQHAATVVYISSLSVLRRPLEPLIVEAHALGPTTAYALSKYWGELALDQYALAAYRGVTLRISSPIAFELDLLHDNVVKKWVMAARAKTPITVFGQGTRTQDFVATRDVAQAVSLAIARPEARGTYHIASGSPVSMRELGELVSSRLGVALRFAGQDPEEAVRWNVDIDRAGHDLGYVPGWSSRAAIEQLLESLP
jgi:UDP-glucose 4-epimerase